MSRTSQAYWDFIHNVMHEEVDDEDRQLLNDNSEEYEEWLDSLENPQAPPDNREK